MLTSQSVKSIASFKSFSSKSFADQDSLAPGIDPFSFKRTTFCVEIHNAKISTIDFRRMMENGMNVCVIKGEFFAEQDMIRVIRRINKAASQMSQKLAREWPIMIGCSLKTLQATSGLVADESGFVHLKQHHEVILTNDIRCYGQCTPDVIFVDNCPLYKEAKVGMEITFSDAKCMMECTEIIDKKSIKCIVTTSGVITHMEPVFLRGCKYKRPELSEDDVKIINFVLANHVDAIIINYATARSLSNIVYYFDDCSKKNRPYIIAGICNAQGVNDIDKILEICDAVMLCRDYLEHELPKKSQHRVSAIQQYLCGKCIVAGVPIYVSGGVFSYLSDNNILLHSEIMDVRRTLQNGVTGLTLRTGVHTNNMIEALGQLRDLCLLLESEMSDIYFDEISIKVEVPLNAAEAAVISSIVVARQTKANLIILPTVSGQTAKYISKYYPPCFIIAVCTSKRIAKILTAFKPVFPMIFAMDTTGVKYHEIVLKRIEFALDYAVRMKWIHIDQVYVTLQRSSDTASYCDLIEIWNESTSVDVECPENANDWP